MNPLTNLEKIFFEYAIRKDNEHVGSGLGGNYENYLFIADKKMVPSADVTNLTITKTELIFNPDFVLNSSRKDLRVALDEKIAEAMKTSEYVPKIKGDAVLPEADLEKNDAAAKTIILANKCAELSSLLDNDKITDEYLDEFSKYLNSFPMPIALYAFRTQVGIERMVKHNLDENKFFAQFYKFSHSLEA